jgi:hypothetical protein
MKAGDRVRIQGRKQILTLTGKKIRHEGILYLHVKERVCAIRVYQLEKANQLEKI